MPFCILTLLPSCVQPMLYAGKKQLEYVSLIVRKLREKPFFFSDWNRFFFLFFFFFKDTTVFIAKRKTLQGNVCDTIFIRLFVLPSCRRKTAFFSSPLLLCCVVCRGRQLCSECFCLPAVACPHCSCVLGSYFVFCPLSPPRTACPLARFVALDMLTVFCLLQRNPITKRLYEITLTCTVVSQRWLLETFTI